MTVEIKVEPGYSHVKLDCPDYLDDVIKHILQSDHSGFTKNTGRCSSEFKKMKEDNIHWY